MRDPDEFVPRRRPTRFAPGPVPTLDNLQRDARWVWVNCARHGCWHRAPMALAPLIIRWGPDTSSDRLRQAARCTRRGGKGAMLMHPSFVDRIVGFQPFPMDGKYQFELLR